MFLLKLFLAALAVCTWNASHLIAGPALFSLPSSLCVFIVRVIETERTSHQNPSALRRWGEDPDDPAAERGPASPRQLDPTPRPEDLQPAAQPQGHPQGGHSLHPHTTVCTPRSQVAWSMSRKLFQTSIRLLFRFFLSFNLFLLLSCTFLLWHPRNSVAVYPIYWQKCGRIVL